MRDLKHLITFEKLLQEANNDLVKQAAASGAHPLGYSCYYIPEVLLDLEGCFAVRLRAPNSGTPDVATYYLTNRNCPYTRCVLERGIEGGYNFLDALFGSETCAAMERMQEHFFLLEPVKNDRFFVTIMDAPLKDDETSLAHYKRQLKAKILDPLRERFGVDTADAAIREAVERHNELCRIITEIGGLRRLPNPPITGYEFHVIQLISQVCPKALVLDMLRDTLEELRHREAEPAFPFRCRVALVGSEIDDPYFTQLIESCGAMVVADRYCFGSFPGREEIIIRSGESALDAVARHYLISNQCPRFMNTDKIDRRHSYVNRLAEEYSADGIIYENMKFCEFWSYEKVLASHVLQNEYCVPCCTIEKEYAIGSMGQLRTRFQAFVESLEIKKLAGRGEACK